MSSRAERSKRQKIPGDSPPGLPPGVWVVATPIGNLSDMTERGKLALERAHWIACEDTRRTRTLLSALNIPASDPLGRSRLRRYDRHTAVGVVRQWIEELKESGASIAVVSDAGTPAVSDPGALLVQVAREEGVQVTPVPGPSAVVALLSVSGWPEVESFCFSGFLPRSSTDIQESLDQLRTWVKVSGRPWISVWFDSPERIEKSLRWISEYLDPSQGVELCVCKELTKVHEKLFRGVPRDVWAQVCNEVENEGALGEWALAIRFPVVDAVGEPAASDTEWSQALECLLDADVKTSECARVLSHRFGVSRETAYARAMEFKKKRRGG